MSKGDGHHGSEGFRRRCQRQAYRRQQQLRQRLAAQQAEDDDHRPPIPGLRAPAAYPAGPALLEGRLLLVHALGGDHVGDVAQLRMHACLGAHKLAAPAPENLMLSTGMGGLAKDNPVTCS